SADCCLKLDALVDGLRGSLGHGCHFYFIDACRNEVSKAVAGSLIPFSMAGGEEPSVFVLQSTVAGAPSLVAGPFSKKLREGLRGAGKAKVWDPPITDSMKVRFDSLRRYLKDTLKNTQPITQSTSGELGESEAVLSVIAPVTPIKLTIAVPAGGEAVTGVAIVTPFDGAPVEHPITAATTILELPPKFYSVTVRLEGTEVEPALVTTEAFDDVVVTFQRASSAVVEEAAPDVARGVRVIVPEGAEVVLRHVAGGDVHELRATDRAVLQPGPHLSTLRDRDGHVLQREEIIVTDNAPIELRASESAGGLTRDAIERAFTSGTAAAASASALGVSTLDPDLHVRLAVLQAAHILRSRHDGFSPGRNRPDTGSAHVTPPVYVLAARPRDRAAVHVRINSGSEPAVWHEAADESIQLVAETTVAVVPGELLVTFAIEAQPTYTVASLARPDHATLIVLTFDEEGQRRLSQYLLPLGTRVTGRGAETNIDSRSVLRRVYTLARMIRAFRKRRRLSQEFTGREIDALLTGPWPDPIGAPLAAYELVRRRKAGETERLAQAAEKMARAFPDLPDTAALARLAGIGDSVLSGVPLFLDGLRAFPDLDAWLPYPAGLLDFGGPWTAWRDAVPGPAGE
ncbi:MAG TPA: hypothetical protein VMZ66_03680, partial [Aeromicrobium sp.]|nr:hypothetical protein [Aeromicrobium sp.]